MEYTKEEIKQANDLVGYLSYKESPFWFRLINCAAKIIGIFSGNQFGKDAGAARHYVTRVLGLHPVPEKNLDYLVCENGHKWSLLYKNVLGDVCKTCAKPLTIYFQPIRTIRCASENLPGQGSGGEHGVEIPETRNTQYPELKKWMPSLLIKRDITIRNPVLVIKDIWGGPDILFEFVGYQQSVQATAGTQRFSVWYSEEPPFAFYEEQQPRLLASDGDQVMALTPANRMSYIYDQIFEKAKVYYRTPTVCQFLGGVPEVEITTSNKSIAVFQAATDDNPTLKPESIERIFADIDDPDVIAIRRYGVFRQVSGRIFKGFDWGVHVISGNKYFPDGMNKTWLNARCIDYHQHNHWACTWVSLSPNDEMFIWKEYNPNPERMTTYEIAMEICRLSGEMKYSFDLIDPLSSITQGNTGRSTQDDLNSYCMDFKNEGIGSGSYWRSWDSKSTRGREEIRKRLKNSKRCLVPFNNKILETDSSGIKKEITLPTLWILDTCPLVAKSFKNWRLEEWADSGVVAIKDLKETPQGKFSHFPMCIEAILKEACFRPRFNQRVGLDIPREHRQNNFRSRYFGKEARSGGRRAANARIG